MTDLEKLKFMLKSPLCHRDTIKHPLPGRPTIYSEEFFKPVDWVLKSTLEQWIKDIEEGKWPLYVIK